MKQVINTTTAQNWFTPVGNVIMPFFGYSDRGVVFTNVNSKKVM